MTAHSVLVSCVGPSLYRLEEEATLFLGAEDEEDADSFPRFGDIIFTEAVDAQTVRYISVYERSKFIQFCYVLPNKIIESKSVAAFLEKVVSEDGHWELQAGGVLFISLPAGSSLDPKAGIFGSASGA
jgi:hypothetical protein